jgi:hypothetical protein
MEIGPLREADDRTTFRSGNPDLDGFLVKYAGQKESRPEPTPMFLPLGLIEGALEPRAR